VVYRARYSNFRCPFKRCQVGGAACIFSWSLSVPCFHFVLCKSKSILEIGEIRLYVLRLLGIRANLWEISHNPNVAIVFAIISDGSAGALTVIKSWSRPQTESGIAYAAGLFNALTAFAIIRLWSFAESAFPIFLVAEYTVLLVAAYHRKFRI
jgi:hypothetical protein